MATVFPGTTIEVSRLTENASRLLFSGLFAAGGITLSQVSVMTGLEPYCIQNWVKRGFVSPPVKRQYSKEQFARIVTINMLRESLQLDRICGILSFINGVLDDDSDDLISDSELYHRYVDMIAVSGEGALDRESVKAAAEAAVQTYTEPCDGAKKRLVTVLQIMAYAHYASVCRRTAEDMFCDLM